MSRIKAAEQEVTRGRINVSVALELPKDKKGDINAETLEKRIIELRDNIGIDTVLLKISLLDDAKNLKSIKEAINSIQSQGIRIFAEIKVGANYDSREQLSALKGIDASGVKGIQLDLSAFTDEKDALAAVQALRKRINQDKEVSVMVSAELASGQSLQALGRKNNPRNGLIIASGVKPTKDGLSEAGARANASEVNVWLQVNMTPEDMAQLDATALGGFFDSFAKSDFWGIAIPDVKDASFEAVADNPLKNKLIQLVLAK